MDKLPIEENSLIRTQGIFSFTDSLAGIFLNIFLFKLGGLQSSVLFGFISFSFLLIFYTFSGWTLKYVSSRVLIYIGLICYAVSYGLLFILQGEAIKFLVPIAIVNGIGAGNFWAGFNISQYIITHEETRSRYFGRSGGLLSISQIFGPVIGGVIISLATYLAFPETAAYALLFLIVVLSIVTNIIVSNSLPAYSKIEFSIKKIINHKRSRNWKLVLLQQFFFGIWDSSFAMVSGILVYLILKGEFAVGSVGTLSALIYGASSLLAGGFLIKNKKFSLIGTIGVPLAILFFAFNQNLAGVIVFGVISGITTPFLNIPPFITFLNTMDESKESWQEKYHFMIEREFVLTIPRIFSFLILFMFFSSGDQLKLANDWIKIIPLFPFIIGILGFLIKPEPQKNQD
jgi:YQGE family putative transporter